MPEFLAEAYTPRGAPGTSAPSAADIGCTGSPVDDETVTVTYPTPSGYASAPAGTCSWTATYSGDANNNPATISCGSGPFLFDPLR